MFKKIKFWRFFGESRFKKRMLDDGTPAVDSIVHRVPQGLKAEERVVLGKPTFNKSGEKSWKKCHKAAWQALTPSKMGTFLVWNQVPQTTLASA